MKRKSTSSGRAKSKPGTIDNYLAQLDPEKPAALETLRRTIRGVAPQADECISYGVPSFRLRGKFLLGFAAAANHCSFYPGSTLQRFGDDLNDYETSKGTIRFQPGKQLPPSLVRKLVKARIAESR